MMDIVTVYDIQNKFIGKLDLFYYRQFVGDYCKHTLEN